MKPAWDQLMEKYADHKDIVITDVDCIGEGKDLCEKYGVRGFPTIKHGDFDALDKFASEMGPVCSAWNLDNCEGEEKEQMQTWFNWSIDKLQAAIDHWTGKQNDAEELFKTRMEELQATHKKYMEEKTAIEEEIKNAGFNKMNAVWTFRNGANKQEL